MPIAFWRWTPARVSISGISRPIHHDVWDYDPDAAPQLVTVQHDGKTVDAVALASKNNFLYVFDRVTGKPLWPIEERPVPQSDVPGEITSKTQPFPTVVPPFGSQGMTVKDMYTGFMKPDEVAWWKDRLTKARTGFYTPPAVGVDTINMPSVNGGALFFSTGADPTNGTVYVLGKNMPSIVKLVPARRIHLRECGRIDSESPAQVRHDPERAFRHQSRWGAPCMNRTASFATAPELKGDRGPELNTVVSQMGAEATRNVITNGRATMPPFPSMPAQSMNELMAFLKQPDLAPLGSAPSAATVALARSLTEPPYPDDVEGPPSRYKTGYGNEIYVINPPWSTITAYDLNTGKIKWQTPYGDVPQAGPSDKLRGNAYPKSGSVITAGGLVLFAGNDSKLYALNSATGKLLFSKELPNGSQGVPAVYEVNGREYILVAVSGGATPYPEGAYMPPGGVIASGDLEGLYRVCSSGWGEIKRFARPAPPRLHCRNFVFADAGFAFVSVVSVTAFCHIRLRIAFFRFISFYPVIAAIHAKKTIAEGTAKFTCLSGTNFRVSSA